MKNGSLEAAVSNVSLQSPTPPRSDGPAPIIQFRFYAGELDAVQRLIETELSEPYTVYVYHYFLRTWPQLCLLAYDMSSEPAEAVGVIVCKLDVHKSGRRRGYIAMLSIRPDRRKRGIAQQLVKLAIDSIVDEGAEEIVLETEVDNAGALALYEKLGFIRDKRLHAFYINRKSAFRLVLPIEAPILQFDNTQSQQQIDTDAGQSGEEGGVA